MAEEPAKRRLLYVSAWNGGPPRGGFRSAVTLLEHVETWSATLWVGYGCEALARSMTKVPVMEPGYLWRPRSQPFVQKWSRLWSDAKCLVYTLKQSKFGCIVVDYEVMLPTVLGARICHLPVAFYLRDALSRRRCMKSRLFLLLAKRGLFLSETLKQEFEENAGVQILPPSQGAVVANSLSGEFLGVELRKDLKFDAPVHLGLVGTLCSKKNQLYFLQEVLPRLGSRSADFIVDLFGDDSNTDYAAACKSCVLESGLGHLVRFHGHVPDPLKIYGQIDIVVQVSTREGIARVVLESACFGIPTVALRIAGVDEYIIDNATGVIVTDGSAMAESLVRLVRDSEERASLGRNAKERVSCRHDPRKVAASFEQVLDSWCRKPIPGTSWRAPSGKR